MSNWASIKCYSYVLHVINFTVDAIPIRVKLNPTNTNIEAFTLNGLDFMCTPLMDL